MGSLGPAVSETIKTPLFSAWKSTSFNESGYGGDGGGGGWGGVTRYRVTKYRVTDRPELPGGTKGKTARLTFWVFRNSRSDRRAPRRT